MSLPSQGEKLPANFNWVVQLLQMNIYLCLLGSMTFQKGLKAASKEAYNSARYNNFKTHKGKKSNKLKGRKIRGKQNPANKFMLSLLSC